MSLTAFYWDYTDIQVLHFEGPIIVLQNAGAAENYGVEPEVTLALPMPIGELKMHLTGSIVSNEYTDYKNCNINTPLAFPPGGNATTVGDCTGNHLTYAPEYEIALGLKYSVPVMDGTLALGADLYRPGTIYHTPDNNLKQGAYNSVNAEISYAFADDRARVRVYGRNLTNEDMMGYAISAFLESAVMYKPPRAVGVELQYNWH